MGDISSQSFRLEPSVIPPGVITPSLGRKKPYDLPDCQVEEGSSNNKSTLAKEAEQMFSTKMNRHLEAEWLTQ